MLVVVNHPVFLFTLAFSLIHFRTWLFICWTPVCLTRLAPSHPHNFGAKLTMPKAMARLSRFENWKTELPYSLGFSPHPVLRRPRYYAALGITPHTKCLTWVLRRGEKPREYGIFDNYPLLIISDHFLPFPTTFDHGLKSPWWKGSDAFWIMFLT